VYNEVSSNYWKKIRDVIERIYNSVLKKVYEKVKLKLTHHAVSYKMELHPAELERNSSFRCPFSRVLQSVFPEQLTR